MSAKRLLIILLVLISTGLGVFRAIKFIQFDVNILNSFNQTYSNEGVTSATRLYEEKLSKDFFLILYGADFKKLKAIATNVYKELKATKQFSRVDLTIDEAFFSKIPKFYFQYKENLLTLSQKTKIKEARFKEIKDEALERVYNPFSVSSSTINTDPLGMMDKFFANMHNPLSLKIQDDFLVTENDSIMLKAKFLDKANYKLVLSKLQELKENNCEAKLVFTSLAFYGEKAKDKIKSESNYLSLLTLILVLVVFFVFFKSLKHMLLSFLLIVFCLSLGLNITSFFFDSIHIITLLMGISVLGLVIDYFVHYFMEENSSTGLTPKEALNKIKKPLLYSALTSSVGFFVFSLSPLSILKQFSLFGVVTLLIAVGAVFFILPFFFKNIQRVVLKRKAPNEIFVKKYFNNTIYLILIFVSVFSLCYKGFDNDIRNFAKRDQDLFSQEQKIKEILGLSYPFEFFVVSGDNEEMLLQNEESLKRKLFLKDTKGSYLSDWIPSIKSQKESFKDYKMLRKTSLDVLKVLGVKNSTKINDKIYSDNIRLITPKLWFKEFPRHEALRQWVGKISDKYYSIVPIYRDFKRDDLSSLNSKNYAYINKVKFINSDLNRFTGFIIAGILIFIFILAIGLSLKFNLKDALKILFAPVSAAIISLGISSLIFNNIIVFHVLGVVLVITLGLDYSFFYYFNRKGNGTVSRSIMLSTLTTISSFGVLILSDTLAVNAFGSVVFSGVLLCWLFVPLTCKESYESN